MDHPIDLLNELVSQFIQKPLGFCFRCLYRNYTANPATLINETHPDLGQEQVCLRIINDVVALLFFEFNSHGTIPVLLMIPFTNHRMERGGQRIHRHGLTIHTALYFFKCPETSLVISNMLTCFLPLNTGFKFSSALIRVFFLASCNPFFLM